MNISLARVAQSAERSAVNRKVGGSNPPVSEFFICQTPNPTSLPPTFLYPTSTPHPLIPYNPLIHNKTRNITDIKMSTPHNEPQLLELQPALVNKLIKHVIPDKTVTSDFKREYSKALSLFILYVQSGQLKKKYNTTDMIEFMEKEGLGRVAN